MQEGAEADPPEQPLNNSIDLESGGEPDDPANCNFRKAAVSKGRAVFIAIVGVLVVIIIALAAALGVEKSKHSSQCPSAASRCPDGWIGIRGKFYYFSNAPGNWTYSQSFCSSHGASLAGIDNLQELGSLLPYKGKLDHWIGLRKDTGQVWKWVNGTEFDHRCIGLAGGIFPTIIKMLWTCEVHDLPRHPSRSHAVRWREDGFKWNVSPSSWDIKSGITGLMDDPRL